MSHDPVRVADTAAWLRKAALDLRAAEVDLAADPPLFEDALFHCQQAAEKALKAFLTWHDVPFRKTHSLEEIGHQCEQIDGSLADLVERAAPLTEYAWLFRYPGAVEAVEKEETKEALQVARSAFKAILARLPEEVTPESVRQKNE